jgi:hypothetical protein
VAGGQARWNGRLPAYRYDLRARARRRGRSGLRRSSPRSESRLDYNMAHFPGSRTRFGQVGRMKPHRVCGSRPSASVTTNPQDARSSRSTKIRFQLVDRRFGSHALRAVGAQVKLMSYAPLPTILPTKPI